MLPAEPTQGLLNDASQELQRCYRKLLFLDKYGIVITKKVDGPEVQIIMTPQQIAHNNSLGAEDNSPMIDTWVEAVERGGHRPTALKASSSAKPMPPLATPLSSRVPPPPPPIPGVSPPSPLWSSELRPSKPVPAVATRHLGDSASDEPPPPSEPPPPITYIPPTGTIIAGAAKAAPPVINAPPAATRHLGDSASDEPPPPSEPPPPITYIPPTGTIIAGAAKAAPPVINAPPAACGPPARAAPVSEATPEAQWYATPDQVVERSRNSNQESVPPIGVRWTLYDQGKTRTATATPKRIVTPAGTAQPHAPMPTRPVPKILFQAHEIHPSYEADWTLDSGNGEELWLRRFRNCMIKDLLVSKRSVQYRSTGGSLAPRVQENDVTMWEPIVNHASLVIGDIVFCAVQPRDRFYGHMIHYIGDWNGTTYWQIGNMKNPPWMNGWCYAEHIFGRLMEVSHVQPKTSHTR